MSTSGSQQSGTRTAVRRRAPSHPHRHGVRWRSKAQLWGFPLCEVALGPDHANGERKGHARAVVAVGNIADGVIAVGGISRGIISIGGISLGLGSVGGISLGLVAALGGVAVAPLACGGVAFGLLAAGGAGCNIHGRLHHAVSATESLTTPGRALGLWSRLCPSSVWQSICRASG